MTEETAPYGSGPSTPVATVNRVRTHHLREMKERGERFSMLTAYEQYAAQTFDEAGISYARFDGSLSGPEKDRAIEQFRDAAGVLLCTQSGGEGRNIQFCNTLINFDVPWNPSALKSMELSFDCNC